MKRTMMAAFCALALGLGPIEATAGDVEDIRAGFDRFVTAQNAHDAKAVAGLLKNDDEFLWITRGAAIWGHDPAIKRFETIFQGTWILSPVISELKVTPLGSGAAQLYVPTNFQIGVAGQLAQTVKFLLGQTWVKTGSEWRIASILPVPVPP